MLKLLLVMQLAAQDSVYSSPGLRRFIAEAALANRSAPAALAGYRAKLETDIAILVRFGGQQQRQQQTAPQEHAEQLEQVETELRWQRSGAEEQRVVGYRAQTLGAAISLLSILSQPWALPTLYGDRLRFIDIERDEDQPAKAPARTLVAIHPLAADRDAVYAFSGGDTTVRMRLKGRTIHVVRVHVEPRVLPEPRTLIFRGDLDLDADRKQIVRMRGEFVVLQAHQSLRTKLLSSALQGIAYADLINGEVDEQFWLPTYQRLEVQARSRFSTEFTPVVRIVTRFRDHEVRSPADAPLIFPDTGSHRHHLTYAASDSVNAFTAWSAEIGAEATSVAASDFDDVAPEEWRTKGASRLDLYAEHTTDVFHFNRVEGLYTGVAAMYRFRDSAPGLTVASHVGWAWSEHTVRGGINAHLLRDRWLASARLERWLVNTNDFVPTLEGDATIGALVATIDDFDYVDRWQATVSAARALGRTRAGLLSFEIGPGYDASVFRNVTHGIFHTDSLFRLNRGVATGAYMRESVALELHPNISGEMLEPGIGAGISYTRGDGAVRWQRIEGRLIARHVRGAITYVGRLDAATVFGGVPPQQIIEFGENEGLPGYAYKQFGGNRGALLRAAVLYNLPFLRAPLHVRRLFVLPNVSPGVGASIQGGWADASSQAARDALASFGYRVDQRTGVPILGPTGGPIPVTMPTDGVRSTANIFITVFGGAIGFGIARPLDHQAPWVFTLGRGGM
jgi:hypothetical protein